MSTRSTDTVLTDITVTFDPQASPNSSDWHRLEKDLYLHAGGHRTAWLWCQCKREDELSKEDKVILDVDAAEDHEGPWESRPGGIWLLRGSHTQSSVIDIDVVFGTDAVDPRPNWTLASASLDLGDMPAVVPTPRLTVRHGKPEALPEVHLRFREDGTFKIMQVSDLHFSTGPGICEDAIDAHGKPLAAFQADPRSVQFVGENLDREKPDLVVLAGDQSEFGKAPDTQTGIFKYTAPLTRREIPFAVVFGNHDDEGPPSLSRAKQMEIFQSLSFNVSRPGPEEIDGVGNYCLEIETASESEQSPLALFFLDSHNQLPVEGEVYDWIKQSQIDWFRNTSQYLRKRHSGVKRPVLSLAFIHIPVPEYDEPSLMLTGGQKRERVMSPKYNSGFYDALAAEGVATLSCGHDHVNDYCALRPAKEDGDSSSGPWLCYGGGSGFGGYGGYGGYHRRVRVFEVDAVAGRIKTWKRVEYCEEKVDQLLLADGGDVVVPAT